MKLCSNKTDKRPGIDRTQSPGMGICGGLILPSSLCVTPRHFATISKAWWHHDWPLTNAGSLSQHIMSCNEHIRLTDDHRIVIYPNKVARADRERLLLPAFPKDGQGLLPTSPPEIVSKIFFLYRLRGNRTCCRSPASVVRNGNMDGMDSTVGHPDHFFFIGYFKGQRLNQSVWKPLQKRKHGAYWSE